MISIVIPTTGRPSLAATIESAYEHGLSQSDEIVVVGRSDGRRQLLNWPQVHYYEIGLNHKCWGGCQRNFGMSVARGGWLMFVDDDDCFFRDGIEVARSYMDRPRPLLFRFMNREGGLIWRDKDLVPGNIGTPSLVVPNTPGKLGHWGCHYEGDYDMIKNTVDLWGEVEWCDHVTTICNVLDRK